MEHLILKDGVYVKDERVALCPVCRWGGHPWDCDVLEDSSNGIGELICPVCENCVPVEIF